MKDSLFQDFACDWSCGKGHQKISVSAQIEVTGKKVEAFCFELKPYLPQHFEATPPFSSSVPGKHFSLLLNVLRCTT